MSLLSRNNRGLLGQGPLAIMQAAQQRRAKMLTPQAPRVIPAGTTVIREADPLRGFSEGMAKLATGLFGDPKVRANREAMSAAMAPEDVTKTITAPGGFRVPGPAGATPVYQDVVDPDDPNAASLRQTLKDPAMAQSAAEMTGTRYVPDQESQVTSQAPASYSTVVARLNAAGRPDLARSYLSSKAAEASLSSNERERLTAERDQEIRQEASILYADNKTQEAVAKLLQLSSNNAVTQAVAQSLNKPPKQPKRYMKGALTFDADGTPVMNKEVLAIQEAASRQKALNKPWTKAQGQTATYATRMWSAMQTIEDLSNFATTADARGQGAAAGLGLNFLTSEQSQMLEQAKRNFGISVLRDESGAAIGITEFIEADKQYFPQHGDQPGVVAQKKQNREDQLNTLLMAAHPSFKLPKRRRPAQVPKYKVVPETDPRDSSAASEPWKRTKSFPYEDEAKARYGVELDARELRALKRGN